MPPIDAEWAADAAKRGVPKAELEERWESSEGLLCAGDEILTAIEELQFSYAMAIEGWGTDQGDAVARGHAELDQALANFRARARGARCYLKAGPAAEAR